MNKLGVNATPTSPSKKATSSSASKIEELRQQKRDLKKKLKSSRRKSEGLFPGTITPPITPTKHLKDVSKSDTMKGAILGAISPQAERDPAMKEAIDLLLGTYIAPPTAVGAHHHEKDAKVHTPSITVSSPHPKFKVTPLPSSPEIAHKHLSQQKSKNKQTVGVQRGVPSEIIPIRVENLQVADTVGSITPSKSTTQDEFSPLNSSPRKKMFGDNDSKSSGKKDTRQRLDTEESFDYNEHLVSSEVYTEETILDSTPATPQTTLVAREREEYEVMDALISSTGDVETPLRHVGKQLFADTPASASLLASLDDLSMDTGSNTLLYVGLIRALLIANGRLKFKFYCLLFYRWKRLVYKSGVDSSADDGIVLYLQGKQAVTQQMEKEASTADLSISMMSTTSGTSASSGSSKNKKINSKNKNKNKKMSPRKSSPTKKRTTSDEDAGKRMSTGSTLSTITVDSDAYEWSNLNSSSPRPFIQPTNSTDSVSSNKSSMRNKSKSNVSDESIVSNSPVSNILNTTVAVDTAMKRREAKRLSGVSAESESSPSSGKISPSSLLRASMTSSYGSNLNASLGSTVDSSPKSKGKKKKKKKVMKSPSKASIKVGSNGVGKGTVPSAALLALSPKRGKPPKATPPTILQPYFEKNSSYFKSLFKCYSQRYAAASISTTYMTVEEYWTLLREFNIGPSAIGKRHLEQTIQDINMSTSGSATSTPLRSGSSNKSSSSAKKTPPRATSRSPALTPSSAPKPSHTTTVSYDEFLLVLTILSSEMKVVTSSSTTPMRGNEKEKSSTSEDMEEEGLRRWNQFLGTMVDSDGAACVYKRNGVKLPGLTSL
jgi:hypothetical protein